MCECRHAAAQNSLTPPPPGPPQRVPGDILSPWALSLHRQLPRWRRWYRACSPATHWYMPGVLQAQLGEPQVPRPALPGLCSARPRQGRGIRTPGAPACGSRSQSAQWRRGCLESPCAVLSRAAWIPGFRGSQPFHVGALEAQGAEDRPTQETTVRLWLRCAWTQNPRTLQSGFSLS